MQADKPAPKIPRVTVKLPAKELEAVALLRVRAVALKPLVRSRLPAKELLPAPREMNWALVSMELVA